MKVNILKNEYHRFNYWNWYYPYGPVTGEVRSQAPKAHQLLLPEPYVRLSPHTALQEPTSNYLGS
jgi:hypothetical protein